MDGRCQGCPDNSILSFVIFGATGLVVAIVFYIIQKLKLNIGVLSLGIDYFQVLALFGAAKVKWPENLRMLLNYGSVTSLNLDVAAPECAGGGLTPEGKWFITMLAPLGVAALLWVQVMLKSIRIKSKARAIEARRKNPKPGVPPPPKYDVQENLDKAVGGAMASFLSFFILVYLNLTKKAFDVFNCEPGDPPDDAVNPTRFMAMEPDQICFNPQFIHVRLLPWALAFAVTYSFAFPVFVLFKMKSNKKIVFEDQLLAAQERGESPVSNPNYGFRLRYSKLYKNFKPDKSYWIIVTLLRKLGICFCGLLFKRNGSFQLAVAMLVLFGSFMAHVLSRPYMDFKERAAIVRFASKRDKERGQKISRKLAAFGQSLEVEQAQRRMDMEEANQLQVANALQKSSKYFVSYNDLEGTLMCCAIVVALSGTMFGTTYFDNPYFAWQGVFLEYLNIFIIVVSIGYFFNAIGREMFGVKKYKLAKNKAKWTGFKSKAALDVRISRENAPPLTAVVPTSSVAPSGSTATSGARLASWGKKNASKVKALLGSFGSRKKKPSKVEVVDLPSAEEAGSSTESAPKNTPSSTEKEEKDQETGDASKLGATSVALPPLPQSAVKPNSTEPNVSDPPKPPPRPLPPAPPAETKKNQN